MTRIKLARNTFFPSSFCPQWCAFYGSLGAPHFLTLKYQKMRKYNRYEVDYQIIDRGEEYPIKTEEIEVPEGQTMYDFLRKKINKYRYAMDLSTKWELQIVDYQNNGISFSS